LANIFISPEKPFLVQKPIAFLVVIEKTSFASKIGKREFFYHMFKICFLKHLNIFTKKYFFIRK